MSRLATLFDLLAIKEFMTLSSPQEKLVTNAVPLSQGRANITFLMDPNHQEGAGSFYQRPFLAYLFAHANGYNFINAENAFSDCHYTEADRSKIHEDWEKIFGFLGAKQIVNANISAYIPGASLTAGQIYHLPFASSYGFLDKLQSNKLEELLINAREEFYSNLERYPELLRAKERGTVIALHLRDLSKGDPIPSGALLDWQMFSYDYGLPDNNPKYYSELYANAVNTIIFEHKIEQPILHIHSTGQRDSFDLLESLLDPNIEVRYFLNSHPPSSFLDLISADILIASHSSFSWLAVLLRNGPSYIRKNFRHFLPSKTQIIPEILLKNKSAWQRFLIGAQMKISYYKFKRSRKRKS